MPDLAAWPFASTDPYPAYDAARAQAPVQWNQELDAHLVLSYEHGAAVLRGSQWSSDPRNNPRLRATLEEAGPVGEFLGRSLLTSDPPAHRRLRGVVSRFFTPHAVRQIRARVGAIVESAFATLSEGEPIELMSELAYPIPLAVIAELFDVGVEGARLLRCETPKMTPILELDPTLEELHAAGAAAVTLMLFLVPLIAQRRTRPGDDLLSALIHSDAGGAALDAPEIVSLCLLLLIAGHETTANLIGNGTLALLQHPDQLDRLRRDPDLAPQAVDELLRYDSPVQVASRIARRDLMLGGTRVRKGERALVVLGAANRDPARYPDPDRLDITRSESSHLSFGNGPHYCVGAGLARLEAQETFRLVARLGPGLRAADYEYSRGNSSTFRRLQTLLIEDEEPDPGRLVGVTPSPPARDRAQFDCWTR